MIATGAVRVRAVRWAQWRRRSSTSTRPSSPRARSSRSEGRSIARASSAARDRARSTRRSCICSSAPTRRRWRRMRESMLRLTKRLGPAARVPRSCETLEATIQPIIYGEALDLIREHNAAGRRTVIISSSPFEVVAPLAEYLGVDDAIATRAQIDAEGRYTGELSSTPRRRRRPPRSAQSRARRHRSRRLRTPTPTRSPTFRCSKRSGIPSS